MNMKHICMLLTALLLAPLAAMQAVDAPKLLLPDWNPKTAADKVLSSLTKVTAPQTKGAHDAEFVCLGGRAYVVSEVNDLKGGEDGGWPFIYSTMSIVNLKTLKTDRVIDFAKGEQAFANETLPVGACWVPRIIQKDPNTLRCYFVSQDPGKRMSQMWYRDYDLSQTPSLPDARPRSNRFRCGGRESNFLAVQ